MLMWVVIGFLTSVALLISFLGVTFSVLGRHQPSHISTLGASIRREDNTINPPRSIRQTSWSSVLSSPTLADD